MPLRWIDGSLQTQRTFSQSLLNLLVFPKLLQVRSVPKSKLLGIVEAKRLEAGCHPCRPTDSVKVMKDDKYPERAWICRRLLFTREKME